MTSSIEQRAEQHNGAKEIASHLSPWHQELHGSTQAGNFRPGNAHDVQHNSDVLGHFHIDGLEQVKLPHDVIKSEADENSRRQAERDRINQMDQHNMSDETRKQLQGQPAEQPSVPPMKLPDFFPPTHKVGGCYPDGDARPDPCV